MTYNVFSGTLNPTHSLTHAASLDPRSCCCGFSFYPVTISPRLRSSRPFTYLTARCSVVHKAFES